MTKGTVVKVEKFAVERYLGLVEELDALRVEEAFDMGVRHVVWSHRWGQTIREHKPTDEGLDDLLTRLSVDVGRSVRTLYRYVELYDRFPDINVGLNQLGKSVSVAKLIGPAQEDKDDDKPDCEHKCARHCKL